MDEKQMLKQFASNCQAERVKENRTLYKTTANIFDIDRINRDIPSFKVKTEWASDDRVVLISRELFSFITYCDNEITTVICDSQYAFNDEFRKYKSCYEPFE